VEEAPAGLPEALGNREQIRQVLLNLALNGSAAAGPEGRVTLTCSSDGAAVSCRVCDTGPGFSDEDLANFGTPFYTTRHDGTGLGLATSLRIVEDLGGTLAVDSNQTLGACVVLTLPVAPDSGGK